ncbi:MAG: hypothetical protein H7Y07_12760 [Pyrinomonadaceae bacterium]|nr:hypothetical protein [Sphingobacteriaceae bacterium]
MINLNLPLKLLTTLFILFVVLSSCKKDKSEADDFSLEYKVKADERDSAYLYTRAWYLWADKLPPITIFQPRDLTDIYKVMDKVKTFESLDKWSFVETKAETLQSQQGSSTDFGFLVKFAPGSNTEIRVTYAYANSTAGLAGIKRSWRLNKINDRVINRSIQADVEFINDIFFGTPQKAKFEFIKPDNSVVTIDLQKTTYTLNTVLYSKVYTKGAKKIGYFVFNEFSGSTSVNELVSTINDFQNKGVNEIVVDLRYNRGGFVSTQDTLANMLAPLSVGRAQKVMYTYEFNKNFSSLNESFKFYKTGTLNLNQIVFIVSPSSASASELLINNLRPVLSVRLIGDTRTYGKPVGFFPIPVFSYNIFPVSFKTVNSNGEADYYSGFPVNKQVADDLNHDFGDEEEANLKAALSYLTTGAYTASVLASRFSEAEIKKTAEINYNFFENIPSATIENRPSRMPAIIGNLQK